MIEASPDITDKIIVQMFSAGGFRLESWNYFTWKDVVFFQNTTGSFKGAALLVYRGDPENDWTFLTPECCQTLANYREIWKSQIGRYPKNDEPLLKAVKYRNPKIKCSWSKETSSKYCWHDQGPDLHFLQEKNDMKFNWHMDFENTLHYDETCQSKLSG